MLEHHEIGDTQAFSFDHEVLSILRELLLHELEQKESEQQIMSYAEEVEKAVEIAAEFHPDLILMDIQLPDMDGLEATKRLKADPATASIPVIAVTSLAMRGDREKIEEAGCAGYFTKPIDIKTFADEVKTFIGS